MSGKAKALEVMREMPDEATLSDIAERLRFIAGVQEGLDQLDRGEKIPHEEVKKRFHSWFQK